MSTELLETCRRFK